MNISDHMINAFRLTFATYLQLWSSCEEIVYKDINDHCELILDYQSPDEFKRQYLVQCKNDVDVQLLINDIQHELQKIQKFAIIKL
jgi:hypothetical protein